MLLPPAMRVARNVWIRNRVCASATHSREDHVGWHDDIVMTKTGTYAWLLSNDKPVIAEGESRVWAKDALDRWGGVM